eukprot:5649921-Pyramimonas_sp.AAC.1
MLDCARQKTTPGTSTPRIDVTVVIDSLEPCQDIIPVASAIRALETVASFENTCARRRSESPMLNRSRPASYTLPQTSLSMCAALMREPHVEREPPSTLEP